MKENAESDRSSAERHATFLRSVLALDSSDPHLPRFVPPTDPLPEAAGAAPVEEPTDVTTRTRRLMSRLRPRPPR